MSSKKTNHVIGYYRPFPWARIGDERNGRSTANKTIRMFARDQDVVIHSFHVESDERIRRPLDDRAVGRHVMALLRDSEASGIMVAQLEHVFTSSPQALTSLERWMDEGISFYCAQYIAGAPLFLTPRGTRLGSRSLISGLAEFQRRLDFEETRLRVKHRKERTSWAGRIPFGFQVIEGRLIEDGDRIDRIRKMKQAHRSGKSYRDIASEFGVSVGSAHRLVRTDLRKLRRIALGAAEGQLNKTYQ